MTPRSVLLALALVITSAASAATFAHDIAPILYEKCAECHRPGGVAPFSLLTYEDVKKRAAQIASATGAGYMPPWLPERGYGDFTNDRSLTAGQIAAIAAWVSAGAPKDPSTKFHHRRAFPTDGSWANPTWCWRRPGPVELPAAGRDIYWNVIFTPEPDGAPLGARHRDPPRPGARGASCQHAGGPRGIGSPSRSRARPGLSEAWTW